MYATLQRINSSQLNIITIEDPIEYQIQGVGQIHVNPRIDLTFANGLRSSCGKTLTSSWSAEIRDRETAEIAIQASLTGHLVLSTLHTNDAASAVTRLLDMGIEPFLISSSVLAMVAQRLVRVLCPECRVAGRPETETLRELGLEPGDQEVRRGEWFFSGGCEGCRGTGYRGRTGVYELMPIEDPVRRLIMERAMPACFVMPPSNAACVHWCRRRPQGAGRQDNGRGSLTGDARQRLTSGCEAAVRMAETGRCRYTPIAH